MNIDYFAKAVAAFVAVLFATLLAFAACLVLGLGSPSALTTAPFVATFTASVVLWVPNKTHGFNVNEIAASLIDAGQKAAPPSEDIADEQGKI